MINKYNWQNRRTRIINIYLFRKLIFFFVFFTALSIQIRISISWIKKTFMIAFIHIFFYLNQFSIFFFLINFIWNFCAFSFDPIGSESSKSSLSKSSTCCYITEILLEVRKISLSVNLPESFQRQELFCKQLKLSYSSRRKTFHRAINTRINLKEFEFY